MGHFDLSSCLHQLLRQSPLQWQFQHVYGHQDKSKNIADIDIWGQLKMVADTYAKVALWKHISHNNQTVQMEQLHNAIPSIQINHQGSHTKIVSNLKKRLNSYIAQQRIITYWQEQEKPVIRDDFDMEVFTHAAQNVPIHKQRWTTKWLCGMCGVRKWLERWKDQNHSKCPRCLTDNESVEHVVHCRHEDATLC